MQAQGPPTIIPSSRDTSPAAIRPDGEDAHRATLEADIRDAVGLGLSEENHTEGREEEREFGTDS